MDCYFIRALISEILGEVQYWYQTDIQYQYWIVQWDQERPDPLSGLSGTEQTSCPPQCVDLSCNELTEVTLPETLPPKLLELDITGNPRLSLDHKSLELLK